MKNIALVVCAVFILFLAGCSSKHGTPVEVTQYGEDSFSVELLFEKDGVKVYRFIDGDEYRYFTIGNGSFQPQEQKIVVSNGKTTTVYHNYDGASGN